MQFIHYVGGCIFNDIQCQEILGKELPLLRTQNISDSTKKVIADILEREISLLRNQKLSIKAQEVVDGLEFALKDIIKGAAHSYLLFEGD